MYQTKQASISSQLINFPMLNKYEKNRSAIIKSNLSSVALEQKHRQSEIQTEQKKHTNPKNINGKLKV